MQYLDSFISFLQYEKQYSQHTIESYRTDLLQFSDFLKINEQGVLLEKSDSVATRSWVLHLVDAQRSPVTINRKIASLKSFYKFLLKRKVISKNPMDRVSLLKKERKLPLFVQEADMETLLEKIEFEDSILGFRDKVILELLYGTGIRLSELIGLNESDFDQIKRVVKVLGKGKKERIIPIGRELNQSLIVYIKKKKQQNQDNNEGPLIVNKVRERLYPMLVYRVVKKYLDLVVNMDNKSPHVIRHTFATHLLNKGADINVIKELLGHTSLAATQVYTHNSLERLKEAFKKAHPKA